MSGASLHTPPDPDGCWSPHDREPLHPELDEPPAEIPGQQDIFGGEVSA